MLRQHQALAVGGLICLAALASRGWAQRTPSNNMFPRWFHDGTRIIFTSDRDGDPELYAMAADGSHARRVTYAPGRDAHPYFSGDDRRILFQSPRGNHQDTNIYVMDSDGSNVVQLTRLTGFAGVPVYSPDERAIVFQWRETNNFADSHKWRIGVIDADGRNLRRITSGAANDQVPSWSRDGRRLIFYSDRTGKDQIYTMNRDGTAARQLIATEFNDNGALLVAGQHPDRLYLRPSRKLGRLRDERGRYQGSSPDRDTGDGTCSGLVA